MVVEPFLIEMEIQYMKVASNIIYFMVKGLTFMKMEINYMKVNTKMVKVMDMEQLFMGMEI